MGKRTMVGLLAVTVAALLLASLGGKEDRPPAADLAGRGAPAGNPDFALLMALQGDWRGTLRDGSITEEALVRYRMVSGGQAVEERTYPDTENEVVTVYYVEDGNVKMHHFCALGNRPNMVSGRGPVREGESTVVRFACPPADPLTHEPHMHAATIALRDADHLTVTWTMSVAGAPAWERVFALAREE